MDQALDKQEYYLNQEISRLRFIERVLAQSHETSTPLLERLRFLAICSSLLDEFFEIRVAGLKRQIAAQREHIGPDGLSPNETLKQISTITHDLVAEQYRTLNAELIPALESESIILLDQTNWNPTHEKWIVGYFRDNVLPVISPLGLDLSHPFPRLVNKSLNFIFTLEGEDAFDRDSGLAVAHVPSSLPRVIQIPKEIEPKGNCLVLLSSVIEAFASELFPGMELLGAYQFRVTRNSDLFLEEDHVDDLALALKSELLSRRFGDVARLEVFHDCPDEVIQFLRRKFRLEEEELYLVNGIVNFNRLLAIYSLVDRPDLKFTSFVPALPASLQHNPDIFEVLKKHDVLLHHPYQSYSPVVDFVEQAASDPHVLAIRQTLYRTGANSPVVKNLIQAAKSGKEVTAVIELRARFDEADNIDLAHQLQEAGAMVVYGVLSYKTHAKMTLVIRKEQDQLTRYVHLGTGNYHTKTAKEYTDFSLLTQDSGITEDVHNVFLELTGLGGERQLQKILQSPFTFHQKLGQLIDDEIKIAQKGQTARIIFKCNGLTEPGIIEQLYRASQAGVRIDLIVRGVCALAPGIKGISENIEVRSVVGRFLEHSRVYYFENDGHPKVYCASADCMERNFFYRVEVAFPIEDTILKHRVIEEALENYLFDMPHSWILDDKGHYIQTQAATDAMASVQEDLLKLLN